MQLLRRTRSWVIPKFMLFALAISATANADIVVQPESDTFVADGVNPVVGTFDVFLDVPVADANQPLLSWNVTLFVSGTTGSILPSDITFNPAGLPSNSSAFDPLAPHADVFPADPVGLADLSLSTAPVPRIAFFSDANPAVSLSSGTGQGLVQVPFSIAAGKFGTFTVSVFDSETALFETESTEISLGVSGTGTITAVPEPSTWILGFLLTTGSVVAGVDRWRKRRATQI